MALPIVLVGGAPAQAADTFQCSGNATIFGAGNDGKLYRYSYSGVGSTAVAASVGVEAGSGWNGFQRVLGGPDGRVYGINANGMYRYRWNGNGWDSTGGAQSKLISTSFADYATAAYRNKITVDEIGDFYVVDAAGKLRWWRYDEGTGAWTVAGRVIDTGWDRYDLIVSAGPGVLWGRKPDGTMYRGRFEPNSQRWIVQHQLTGDSWGMFDRGIFSVGGDTLFGVRGNGDLNHYRFREAGPEPVWPVGGTRAGNGWQGFANVFGVTDTCRLTERHIPVPPAAGIQAFTSIAVRQGPNDSTQLGPIEYVYSDNIGRLRHGYQGDPNIFGNTIQWSTVPTDEAFTGTPALVVNGQNTLQVLAHNITSETWSFTRAASPSRSWQAGLDLDGAMQSRPVAVRLTDGSLVAFAVDAERNLWFRSQDGAAGDLLPWRRLPAQNVSGEVVAVAGADRSVTVFTQDFDSMQWRSSIYRDGALTGGGWLGGVVGTPAVVVMPGRILRVFARATDGFILTQQQGPGGAWPGRWLGVGTFATAGPPAAILDPQSGRLTVVARGADDHIYRVVESAPGVGTWGEWARVYTSNPDPVATEPTIAEYTSGEGQSWLIVARNQNDAIRIYTRDNRSALRSRSAPTFTRHTLPAPPR